MILGLDQDPDRIRIQEKYGLDANSVNLDAKH
jgi:hypothetical protein